MKNGKPLTSIEVWITTCIVTNFGKTKASNCSVLINPSNPGLTGVKKFPYFPRGGPEPKEGPNKDAHHIMGYVTQWGGMDVGSGMLFASNVVDGLVHQLGGWRLAWHCKVLPVLKGDEKCPVGHAVVTPPGGKLLSQEYDDIVHTVPPFYKHHPDPEHYLGKCYKKSLSVASSLKGRQPLRIACPLLGAGGRGFPVEAAVKIAAKESVSWRDNVHGGECVLAFGIPEKKIAEELVHEIKSLEEECSDRVLF